MATGWSTRPTAFVHVVEANLREKRNQIAGEALQMVITGSPVQEGVFKGNHRVSVDGEDLSADYNAKDPSGSATLEAGLAVIASADQPYQSILIQNNVVYAEALEGGHSMNAPNGIYRPAFATLRAKHAK